MIELKIIESLLGERRKELDALRRKHEALLKRFQNELGASQNAFHQVTGAITELEGLKQLAGRNGGETKEPWPWKEEAKHV